MKSILGFLTLFIGISAHAGFMVEPFLGYDSGANKVTAVSGTSSDSKFTGFGYGARLGYRFGNGVSLAAEYTGGSGKIKYDTAGLTDDDYTRTALGAVVGFDRGMWRVWAGYGFSDELTAKATSSDTKYKGSNYKIGVGVMPIHHMSINFEYLVPKYTKYSTAGGADTDVSTLYSTFDTSVMVLSISAPFDFGK